MPFRARPIQPIGYRTARTWARWLVDDQREASGRPDVVVFVSDVLTAPVKISGPADREPVASTSGTDSDWVVKLIDVYPDEVAGHRRWAAISSWSRPTSSAAAIARAWRPQRRSRRTSRCLYRFALPTANHVFLPGHRIMVQVQSRGFRSTTAIRRRSCRISSGPSRRITRRRRSGSTTPATSNCLRLDHDARVVGYLVVGILRLVDSVPSPNLKKVMQGFAVIQDQWHGEPSGHLDKFIERRSKRQSRTTADEDFMQH